MRTFSRRTVAISLTIVLFAEFGLPLYKFISARAGSSEILFAAIWIAIVVCATLLARLLLSLEHKLKRFIILAVASGLAVAVCLSPLIEARGERIHIVFFGLLGWSSGMDMASRSGFQRTLGALGLCFAVAGFDEILQSFVPSRYGQWKDVLLGVLGGLSGLIASFSSSQGPLTQRPRYE